jgi:hypothetical protein
MRSISVRLAVVTMAAALLILPAAAPAHDGVKHTSPFGGKLGREYLENYSDAGPYDDKQHDGESGHLPPVSENVELVGKYSPASPFGDIVEGQIADVAVFGKTAYLNSWDEETCTKGGVYSVDISNPAKPRQLGFIPALTGNYHGEGAHVVNVSNRAFKGDLLAVNNEFCSSLTEAPALGGGFDLYDVSDPANPKVLVQGFGDFGKEGSMTGLDDPRSTTYHSVFLWNDDGRTYLVGVDNSELHDVDIFDVSNPSNPKPVKEFDLLEMFPSIRDQSALDDEVFHHDMVVKEIGGRDVLMASYWDAGYVAVDIEDPTKPSLIRDSSFDGADPETGLTPQQGNAHQGEFSYDNQYFLAADEDFAPYRTDKFFVGDQQRPATEIGGGLSPATLPDVTLNGPAVYGGYGCPGSAPIPQASSALAGVTLAPGEEKIVVLQRGPAFDPNEDYDGDGDTDNDAEDACFPGVKVAAAYDAGYTAVVIANRHQPSGLASSDEAYCGSGGEEREKNLPSLCTTHAALHEMFGDTPEFSIPADDTAELVPLGTVSSQKVRGTSKFDGWGYAHLYRNTGTKMQEIDTFAIPESLIDDPEYQFSHGDLSIHEFATDPETSLAYASYYAGGLRVFRFGASGIQQVGAFIDNGGNNLWGVEQFTHTTAKGKQQRLIAASDRDHGLYIYRYTGR